MQVTNDTGFTLIELIAVIVLLSILGVVALSRLGSTDQIAIKGFYDDTVSALRYAQKLAISTGCTVQVSLTATGYDLHQQQTDCTTGLYTRDVLNPADRTRPYENFNPDVTISPVDTFVFTPQSNVTGLDAGDTLFSVNGFQFMVYEHTGLVDAI